VNLQQAATKVFGWSQRNLMLFLGCGLGLLLLAIVSFWTWPADVDAALIVAAITVQCGQTFYRYRSLKWHAAGDEIRRLNLSQEALGSTVPQAKLQKVLRTVGRCDEPVDPKYWRSKAAKGPTRLVEMTLEAAYYTETTAAACKMLFGIIAVTGVIVVVIVMVIMLRLGADRPSSELSIRILTTLLAYFVATDCWILAYEYGHLEEAACAAQDCCFALLSRAE
jgi:hypothetical protein